MPAPRPSRLSLLAFPQRWEAGTIRVRFLCLPKGDPEAPPGAGLPPFATANLVFAAHLIGNLDHQPQAADATLVGPLTLERPPVDKAVLLSELTRQFRVVPRVAPVDRGALASFRKPLTASYRALAGNRQLSRFIVGADAFACVLHEAQASQPPEPVALDDGVTWGRLIAFVLKQPTLAEACGFMGEATVTLPDPALFARGGWLFIDLHETSDYAAAPAGFTSLYAARIPPLGEDRPLYAAVLFPVDGANPLDDGYREAERYSFGFARMVHGAQEAERGDAIRLAWDDEQVAEWFNRQIDPAHDAPMGTAGYRVDVRHPGDGAWHSLQRIGSLGDLLLGATNLGPWSGDAVVEVAPAQIAPDRPGEYWMPPYFATWRGSSLALTDQDLTNLHQHPELNAPALSAHRLGRETVFAPLDDKRVPLLYGKTYEFRVRLADLTRGGPASDDDIPLAPDSVATVDFRRRTRPAQITVLTRPTQAAPALALARPRLGYPHALFTGKVNFAELESDFLAKPEREFSVPDPDVVSVEIQVAVRTLGGDAQPWLPLYTTRRAFAADTLTLALSPQDHPTLATLAAAQPDDGALVIPTARDVRLTLTALGHDEPDYFASDAARIGVPISVEVHTDALVEAPLFAPVDLPVRGFFFQPPPNDGSVANPVERLAQELGLDCGRLTLSGRAGHRTLFAASAELQHTLAGERSALTIASNAELIRRWVNVLRLRLDRDWTWDGLAEAGVEVRRVVRRPGQADGEQLVGSIQLSRALSAAAIADVPADARAAQRQFTDIYFFDACDPKPPSGAFPTELTFAYRLVAAFKGAGPGPAPETLPELLVPVTTPPTQTPKLVSAGIALSPFVSAPDYVSTEQRTRALWLEFEAPPADPDDAYVVRVLADAPDPMLIAEDMPEAQEAPLPVDPEWMRLIVPGQPRDTNGLNAMRGLATSTPDGRHWIVPLPEGVSAASPELFGFYTYEIRLGHTDARWSSAQGRHGPALRVTGVQHPAPPLVCQAARTEQAILIRAPFATPVAQGRNLRPRFPKTELWAVLYARVRQADGVSWRNLVLGNVELTRVEFANLDPGIDAAVLFGEGAFPIAIVQDLLRRVGLPANGPLTALAVELFRNPSEPRPAPAPVGADLGFARVLRVSPLAPVPDAC
jgi:hypothetical protein